MTSNLTHASSLFFATPVYALLISGLTFLCTHAAQADDYHPLKSTQTLTTVTHDLEVVDAERDRTLPIRVYLPEKTPAPVILFSHGLGGSPDYYSFLGEQWGKKYVTVMLQHPGSDASIWQDQPLRDRMKALTQAANAKNYRLRAEDVTAVINQLEIWNQSDTHPLADKMDLGKIGMSGHSFGAHTTQAVSGQKTPWGRAHFRDKRIDAAVIMSPSSPKRGKPEKAFGDIDMPWMLMTGTRDLAPIGGTDMASRLAVFPALPSGDKYELVLFEAEHSIFTDHDSGRAKKAPNPNHHRVILALSQALWDAHLSDNPNAKNWLDGHGAKSVLEAKDRWQIK